MLNILLFAQKTMKTPHLRFNFFRQASRAEATTTGLEPRPDSPEETSDPRTRGLKLKLLKIRNYFSFQPTQNKNEEKYSHRPIGNSVTQAAWNNG